MPYLTASWPSIRQCFFTFVALLFFCIPFKGLQAEGSWQMGLFEGLSYRQPLYETNVGANRSVLRVDILAAGEVINILACGTSNTSNLRIRIFDPSGTRVYNTSTTDSNVNCNDDFTGTFDPVASNAHQHTTTTTGTYEVHLTNFNGTIFNRFDVTVTDNVTDQIDPKENGGRLWSDYWYFWAGSFAESASTDADLYVVADGGFVDTYYIWKLDLNNFAGFGYGLKANNLGVVSPNAAGDVVAGMSVPSSGNSIVEQFPIYLSYPEKIYPAPSSSFNVSPLEFLDSDNVDNAITSGGNGSFYYTTDYISSAVYEIIIDTSSPTGGGPDGIYGQGDIFLRGIALPGANVVPWDGRDNNGDVVPLGAYTAELSVRIGEFHFSADDVETSGGPNDVGLKMYLANPNGIDTPATIYWDDSTVLNSTAPNAFNQLGIYDGDHNWGVFNSGGIGNVALIDTYTYGLSVSPNPTGVAIVPNDRPLATIRKSFVPAIIPHGGTSNMQFEISNNGTTTLTGVNLTDTMPFGMTLVTDPSAITVTGAGCSGFAFSTDTVIGGDVLNITDGTMTGNATCVVAADVTAVMPGDLVNTTSGVTTNELPFGVISNGASLLVQPELSGTPFACDASLYELEEAGSSTRLYKVNTDVSPFTRTEFTGISYGPSVDYSYTGLAYHPTDHYLYAIVTASNNGLGVPEIGSVVRIDADGKVVDLGVPERGPNTMTMPVVSDQFVGGTFTASGNYVVVTDTSATASSGTTIPVGERGLVLEIDVSTNPPQVLFNRVHGRDVGDIVAHPNGSLLSHTAAEGLIAIDSQTGAVTSIGGNVSARISSLMADNWGQLYAHTENTNELFKIDASTGVGTLLSTLPGAVSADGASCAYGVSIQKTVSALEIEPGNSVTYTLSLVNAGASPVSFDLLDNLQDTRTYVAGSLLNPIGGSANSYADTNLLTVTGATLAANSTATVQYDVMYPPSVGVGTRTNQAVAQIAGEPPVLSDFPTTAAIGDATPIEVLASPGIGISKRAIASGSVVSYWFNVVNTGSSNLDDLSLVDDLDAVFGAGNYSVLVPPVLEIDPGTIVLNNAFTGSGFGSTLIDAASNSSLSEGGRAVIRITVEVSTLSNTGSGYGVYSNQVDIFALTPTGNVLSDQSVDGYDVDPDGNGVADEQSPTIVSLQAAFAVTGVVFEDNGATGVAHDGQKSGGERPLGGVVVALRDNNGVVVDTAVTNTDGSYEISIPVALAGTQVQVIAVATPGYQSISEAFSNGATGSVIDSTVLFNPDLSVGSAYQIDFGRVKQATWLSNSVAENNPDTVVFHAHQYQPKSNGDLTFSYADQSSSPNNPSFSAVLYLDTNCNGMIDGGEVVVSGSIPVTYNSSICVVNKVFIPGNAGNDDTYSTTVAASLNYSDPIASGHGVSSYLELTDITRVVALGEGVLVLSKTVQNVSNGAAVTTRNTALPGDVLRYAIDFNNNGTGSVTEVLVTDSTPAYSILETPVQCPATLPDGIVGCQVMEPSGASNVSGYDGAVRWQFHGALTAGAGGTVWFEVRIE